MLLLAVTLQPDEGVNSPTRADLLVKERRCRLMDFTRETFPQGKVPKSFQVS